MRNKKSFTLIELLVVIAIIGILSSLVIARFSNWNNEARIANTLQWSAGVHRTLGANLVGYWPLNGNANDISSYGNHGEMHNFAGEPEDYWADGVPGTGNQALKFDGVNDYVNCGLASNIPIGNADRTLSVWLYKTGAGRGDMLPTLWLGSSTFHKISALGVRAASNNIGMTFWSDELDSTVQATTSKWFHVVGTYSGATRSAKLYINGAFSVGKTLNSDLNSPANVYIGNDGDLGRNFEGLIDEVRIYDTALTAEEVGRIYAETKDQYLVHE